MVDRIVPCVRQGYDNKQTQYPQGISGQRRKRRLLKKILCKSPALLLFVHCVTFLFFLGFISGLHCVRLLRGHKSYVAAAAITSGLNPAPYHKGTFHSLPPSSIHPSFANRKSLLLPTGYLPLAFRLLCGGSYNQCTPVRTYITCLYWLAHGISTNDIIITLLLFISAA